MAWFDCGTLQQVNNTQTDTNTHVWTWTLSATTQLATVCVSPPSLLQASRSALRQGKPTHTLTHNLPCSTPIFLDGKRRGERKTNTGTTFYICYKIELLLNSDPETGILGISCLVLKVVSKRFSEYRHYKRNMHNSAWQPNETQKLDRKKGIWTYVKDFGSKRTCNVPLFFGLFWMVKWEDRSDAKGFHFSSSENTLAKADPVRFICAQSPPVTKAMDITHFDSRIQMQPGLVILHSPSAF